MNRQKDLSRYTLIRGYTKVETELEKLNDEIKQLRSDVKKLKGNLASKDKASIET